MKKQHNKPTVTLPVSQKFYDSIMQRITAAAALLSDPERSAQVMKQTIEAYITRGCEPVMASGIDVMIVFALLRPEIDKALDRSRRARQRALKRRSPNNLSKDKRCDDAPESIGIKTSLLIENKRRGLTDFGYTNDMKRILKTSSKKLSPSMNWTVKARPSALPPQFSLPQIHSGNQAKSSGWRFPSNE